MKWTMKRMEITAVRLVVILRDRGLHTVESR